MKNQEILHQAIDKASGKGYLDGYLEDHEWYLHANSAADGYILCMPDHKSKTKIHIADYSVIFSHDFAKAFYGTEAVCEVCGERNIKDCACTDAGICEQWAFHLPKQVLEDNPISYLEKFL